MSKTNEEVKVTKDEKTGDTIMKKPTRYARTEPTAQEVAAEEALKAREEVSETEEDSVEPTSVEEQSFKKRYGDLRRHMQKTTEDKDIEMAYEYSLRQNCSEELDIVYRDLQRDISQVEKRLLLEIKSLKSSLDTRVSLLEKWRWLIIGGALAIGFILAKNMPKIINSAGWF